MSMQRRKHRRQEEKDQKPSDSQRQTVQKNQHPAEEYKPRIKTDLKQHLKSFYPAELNRTDTQRLKP